MIPNLYILEQLVLERVRKWQREAQQEQRLVQSGFTAEEIVALLWLRQWYQMGDSDRYQLVCCWEFLRLLIMHGKLEV